MSMAITGVPSITSVIDLSMETDAGSSLDERMIRAYAQTALNLENEQQAVLQKLEQASVTTDPAELFKLQQRTADYNMQVSLISTLTRKAVSTVETLLRS